MRIAYVAAIVIISVLPVQAGEGSSGTTFCEKAEVREFRNTALGPGSMNGPNLCQDFGSIQQITQDILNGPDAGGTHVPRLASSDEPVPLRQTATNVVNYVDVDQDFKMVAQQFSGKQNINNTIVTGALGALTSISQEGSNTANTVQGTTIELAVQVMEGGSQYIDNNVQTGGTLAGISQSGSNVANLATAEHAIGVGYQDIDNDSTQTVVNAVDLAAQSNVADRIVQSGTNIGNVLIAERVDEVVRKFEGTQTVDNTVILNDGYRPRISQSGNNIANFISANSVGSIEQISNGHQEVRNVVLGPNGEEIKHANFEQSESNYLGASNVVNLMIIAPKSGESRSDEDMNITQTADFEQTAKGSNSQSQSGNVLVVNR